MRNGKLCRQHRQPSHDLTARTVLKASRAVFGILTFVLWIPSALQAAHPQVRERIELGPRREAMNRDRTLRDGSLLAPGERERVLNKVQERFNELQSETKLLQPKSALIEPDGTWLSPPRRRGLIALHDLAGQHDSQDYVRWVQDSLNKAMLTQLMLNGINTAAAKEAIREFQRTYGLVPDGIIGPRTESKLAEVTNTQPPERSLFMSFVHNDVLKLLREANSREEPPAQADQNRIFLDVRKDKGRFWVNARKDGDLWLEQAGLPELANGQRQRISSIEEFEKLLGESNTVVHQGDDLPEAWTDRLRKDRAYLRHSRRSHREGLGEFVRAAELLDRHAELGKTRVFNALPQASEDEDLHGELLRMGLNTKELKGWQQLRQDIGAVQAVSEIKIEEGTKEAFLQELREGEMDTIVLIAHSEDGAVHFRNGETLSAEDLSAIQREIAPDRNLILSTCEAGKVNAPVQSFSEALLAGNLGLNVIAHPEPISGADVPDILRELLVKRKTFREVFVQRRGYVPVSENLDRELGRGKQTLSRLS